MGYIFETVTRTQKRVTGAKCDECGAQIPMGRGGAIGALELIVDGAYPLLYGGYQAERLCLVVCRRCADTLLEVIPSLRYALKGE